MGSRSKLCTMPPANSGCEPSFATMCITTLPAPALCPLIVTQPGSPPNAAMLAFTHFSARIWSCRPALLSPLLGSEVKEGWERKLNVSDDSTHNSPELGTSVD